MGAAGLVAVWATENTRESLFDAMRRKEAYATTGPRIRLRFFGGWDFDDDDTGDVAANGYEKGVPMGGDLSNASGRAPSFLVAALKDPVDGNLDRIQVIKGWVDAGGMPQEKIYNVAWSDNRKMKRDGSLPPVGNTVDVSNGNYENTIGDPMLAAAWTDPDFDPQLNAFYYVRVLQIPTPRHTLFDALALNIPVEETGQPAYIQERAYSSPIWYSP